MDIRIITSCTGEKVVKHPHQLRHEDFLRGPEHVREREQALASHLMPAEQLYAGKQHANLMRGVAAARAAGHRVSVHVVSAGYGLVPGDRLIAPYNVTFNDMDLEPFRQWARDLVIARDVHSLLEKPADVTFLLLGDRYFDAARVEQVERVASPTYSLCGTRAARDLPPCIKPVLVPQSDTSVYGVSNIGLKGEVMARILEGRHALSSLLTEQPAEVPRHPQMDLFADAIDEPVPRARVSARRAARI